MEFEYKLKQVCVQNPIFGPRNLGHYWGSMKDFIENQDVYTSYLIIDDLMAILMNPAESYAIKNRTYFVIQDFINCGLNFDKTKILLTSTIVDSISNLICLYSSFFDFKYCSYLYENSFLGGLKSYQREALGLNLYPSIFEIVYPQLGMPMISFALETELFQGGEEIIGYTYIMKHIKDKMKVYDGLSDLMPSPIYEPSKNGYVLGTDGTYMFQHNCIFLAEDEESIIEKIDSIRDGLVIRDWMNNLGKESVFEHCDLDSDFDYLKSLLKEYLIEELENFRSNKISNDVIDHTIKNHLEYFREKFASHIEKLQTDIYRIF